MEENITNTPAGGQGGQNDCGCADGNCKPKKNNPFTKIIFGVIVIAALGIIAVKVFNKPVAGTEATCKPGSGCGDTTKGQACDTTKGSSCCPK